MPSPLSIICSGEISDNDKALAVLAEFLGVPARMCSWDDPHTWGPEAPGAGRGCAVSGETLAFLMGQGHLNEFKNLVEERLSSLFVYGVSPGDALRAALGGLTDGRVKEVLQPGGNVHGYRIGEDEICRQMAGLSLDPREAGSDHVFAMGGAVDTGEKPQGDAIIMIDRRPFFVGLNVGKCRVFVLGSSQIADVRREVDEHIGMRRLFSSLVPPAMYIKYAFGDAVWHSEKDRACLIVDDPLLRKRYGFLDFGTLADLMDSFGFTTSIGFIPWNFKRTGGDTANLFAARSDRFSLCVHGCNHTRSEFGNTDERDLTRMTRIALERMKRHEVLTGVAFDRIMVFPQGIFSTRAMEALKATGYLAAVNLEAIPVDFRGSLPASAFLEPAIMAFGGFPLFTRRWPEDTEGLATDLFWGRPVLLTTHHDFFKEGCRNVVELMDRIGSVNAEIEWRSLGDIIRGSHLVREEPDNAARPHTRVKGYVAEISISNATPAEKRYTVAIPDSKGVPLRVLSGGNEMDYELSDRGLEVSFILPPRRKKAFAVIHFPRSPDGTRSPDGFEPARRAVRTRMRRYLSEIRDNYISRNAALLSLATTLKDRIFVSKHTDPYAR